MGGRRELDHAHVAGVELGNQTLDRTALAGGIPPLEQHANRGADALIPDQAAERQPQLG
jgi:hypothetical protein